MSLSKKDPSLRVAANDPHLVSLGGGRLSTAVTIHNIPVGDTTIGSSVHSNISLSGLGVRPLHCTIYRSEENQVTLVPEREARILIDGHLIEMEVDLKQGAMITLGESYYLRYNNPAEAQQMRTAMGNRSEDEYENDEAANLDYFYETNINPNLSESYGKTYNNLKPLDINGWQCPKVFTADLVTVNMPAKDVLGQKYANFAKNLAENHRKDKNVNTKHNEGLYVNIPGGNSNLKSMADSCEFLSKVQNTSTPQKLREGGVKSEEDTHPFDSKDYLEDMLKICTEYTDRQDRSGAGGSSSSSPIVQNRIKTNGSLPRDKKSPFHQEFNSSNLQKSSNDLSASPSSAGKSSGYENVRLVAQNRVEIDNSDCKNSSGYENVKIVPQSPRTKIRTNCLSPKKGDNSNASFFSQEQNVTTNKKATNYEDLIKIFEEKFQKEIEAIEESSRNGPKTITLSANNTPVAKRTNKNINNLTIDIKSLVSPNQSPKAIKKPTPAPRNITKSSTNSGNSATANSSASLGSLPNLNKNLNQEKLHIEREDLLRRLNTLKEEISVLQQQDNEALIEMDMENALVLGELHSLTETKHKLEQDYKNLQQRIHRLEAQRNATRVMEENQQAKLKQSIEMKQDQVEKLKDMLKQKPNNACLKEELDNVRESLDNDRKAFEDLEFQYLEGESEWHAQRDELHNDELGFQKQIEETKLAIGNLERQDNNSTSQSQKNLRKRIVSLLNDLQECEQQFRDLEEKLSSKCHGSKPGGSTSSLSIMSQSLFGSTEILCPKPQTNNEDLMSKSFNENMFYNNKIEMPKNSLQVVVVTASNSNSRVVSQEFASNSGVGVSYTSSNTSKEASNKIVDSIREIERNRKLLSSKQGQKALEEERRKIEEILRQLGSETRQQYIDMLNSDGQETLIKENKENRLQKRNSTASYDRQASAPVQQQSQKVLEKQLSVPPGQRPLSESNSEAAEDLLVPSKRKSINEASNRARSPESPRSFSLEKRSSSVLSNETSSQGDSSVGSERRKVLAKHQRPLTRYLPIFAQDLDLKRHIESAGHQISLCPHIFIDSYTCRGYLHKLGSTFHTWSKRWFVLDRQRCAFIYYSDKTERKPRGGAYFSSIDEVYMDHLNQSKSSRPHCTFIVKTKKRQYYLQAASDAAARIWMDVIITGAQGSMLPAY